MEILLVSQTLSSDFQTYKQDMQQARDERYQSMIDELPPIEDPISRKKIGIFYKFS